MDRLFNLDNPVMKALSVLADVIILNIIYVICCLPLFTIGAATSAMYYVSLKLAEGEDGYAIRRFFKSFKENFKQATKVHIISLIFIGVFCADVYIVWYRRMAGIYTMIPMLAVFILTIIFLSWFYPVLSKFDNTLKNTCKNTVSMAIINLPFTVIVVVVNLLPYIVLLFFTEWYFKYIFVFILVGASGPAYINSFMFNHCFKKYIKE